MIQYEEKELQKLRLSLVTMMDYTKDQLQKAKEAILNDDLDLAEEVKHNEAKVNAFELSLNRDCENYLALHQPVAGDLRLLIVLIKSVTNTERIGDHAYGIAKFVLDNEFQLSKELIKKLNIEAVFDQAEDMLNDVIEAMENEESGLARKVFRKDKFIDNANLEATDIIKTFYAENPDHDLIDGLYLFRAINKLERVGDQIKNIAEEIIFYLEAKVLRHAKKKHKLDSPKDQQ